MNSFFLIWRNHDGCNIEKFRGQKALEAQITKVMSIDDYGTGYSSLAYLKRLPVKEMKIDRTFIKDMAVDEDDRLIVGTTIDMGHNFGLRVIAEGVEDGQTVDLLKQMGCDQVQGYYYAMPMPVDELYDWMTLDNKVAWTLN